MEIHNGNYEEILVRQGQTLDYGDKIIFRINGHDVIYSVAYNHCSCINGPNDKIFTELKLNPIAFCERSYGYQPKSPGSIWPTSIDKDYQALTKVVLNLFSKIVPPSSEIFGQKSSIGVSMPQSQTFKIIL